MTDFATCGSWTDTALFFPSISRPVPSALSGSLSSTAHWPWAYRGVATSLARPFWCAGGRSPYLPHLDTSQQLQDFFYYPVPPKYSRLSSTHLLSMHKRHIHIITCIYRKCIYLFCLPSCTPLKKVLGMFSKWKNRTKKQKPNLHYLKKKKKIKATKKHKKQWNDTLNEEAKRDFSVRSKCSNSDLAVRILEINSRSTTQQMPDTLLSKLQRFQIINFSNMLNEKKSNLSTRLRINMGGKVLTMLASAMEGKTLLGTICETYTQIFYK